ncbi:MAG: Na+/H+ antiporter NhaA [Gammaproteobacteria bacterium]|nr:Na+/H+ antiporter NhaA [Gammaproteobacteria bacterium]RPG25195.1 MAG: Na+/H+ antiporter NhaA [Gammaproteobacteria bacterium TMED50]
MATRKRRFIFEFLEGESAGGLMLMGAAVAAMIMANTPLFPYYQLLTDTPFSIQIGDFTLGKPLLLWVNDGLMAIFFLLVGLELKRELIEGELSDPRQIVLPAVGAVGGMAIPAAVYLCFNYDDPLNSQGWAIPAATDIAFALGILTLMGSRVPTSLKVFLTSLAIFDDIGAIIIIALFYTDSISVLALAVALACIVMLAFLNIKRIDEASLYFVFGLVMWVAMLKSGVHATLAGVILAMFIPIKAKDDPDHSPLKELEHDLHPAVAFVILPIFAFFNAGINLSQVDLSLHPVTSGIVLGLFIGKQLGIFACCYLAIRLGFASLPKGVSMGSLYGAAALCGVGFTMSLFIGSLAFGGVDTGFDERLGIIIGSLLSGTLGYAILATTLKKPKAE